jgi:hypothetical protein
MLDGASFNVFWAQSTNGSELKQPYSLRNEPRKKRKKREKTKEHGKKMVMSFCIIIRKEATKPLKPPLFSPPPKSCPICYVWTRWHALSESSVSWRHGTIFSSNIFKGAGDGGGGGGQTLNWTNANKSDGCYVEWLLLCTQVFYTKWNFEIGLHVKKKGNEHLSPYVVNQYEKIELLKLVPKLYVLMTTCQKISCNGSVGKNKNEEHNKLF